jgi:NAD(P)-dependent dehydrogenase (short-subunit alcohol dehydrogenase family)
MDLTDTTIIITGAGSGVGRAIALAFGAAGARVSCVGRRAALLDETVSQITAGGGQALAVPADITEAEQVAHMVAQTEAELGPVDVLYNNAGSFVAIGAAWEVDIDDWWQDVTVNLLGTMLCCRAVLPGMLARHTGLIINMAGGNQIPGGTGYSCSKLAIERFTELLAKEVTHEGGDVVVCLMGPGFVRTEMTELQITSAAGQKWLPSSKDAVETGRDRPPEDCAAASVRLVALAAPSFHGGHFGPDTDFAAVRAQAGS